MDSGNIGHLKWPSKIARAVDYEASFIRWLQPSLDGNESEAAYYGIAGGHIATG